MCYIVQLSDIFFSFHFIFFFISKTCLCFTVSLHVHVVTQCTGTQLSIWVNTSQLSAESAAAVPHCINFTCLILVAWVSEMFSEPSELHSNSFHLKDDGSCTALIWVYKISHIMNSRDSGLLKAFSACNLPHSILFPKFIFGGPH